MATKAFEIDARVGFGRPDTDGGVTQLMKCPSWRIVLPKGICLPV
jgi:hypothetical protein